MSGLDVTTTWETDAVCRIALRGEARLDTVGRFDEAAAAVESRDGTHLLLDLTQLTFMDSASTGSLLRLHRRMEGRGDALVLYGLPRVVARLFHRLGFDETFAIAEDEADARARLGA